MAGKIFKESSNIYQDQAKVMFDYYAQAAERIVSQEEAIEKQIADIDGLMAQADADFKKKQIYSVVALVLCIVVGIVATTSGGMPALLALVLIPVLFYFFAMRGHKSSIQELSGKKAGLQKKHKEIFRDYKMTKMGVAYVPVADQIKYEDKSFIVDYTGNVPESEVSLHVPRRSDLLVETMNDIKLLSAEAPIVETSDDPEEIETDDYSTSIQHLNQNDYFGKMERSLRTVSFCMDDMDKNSVTLPLVTDDSQFLEFLNEFGSTSLPDGSVALNVFDKTRYEASVSKFQEISHMKDSLSSETENFEDVVRNVMTTMAASVQAISSLKVASSDKVINESNRLLLQILKAPYNHYSPMLEHDEIERIRTEKFDYNDDIQGYTPFSLKQSSRVKYNIVTGEWVAEDGSACNTPFGVHQIYEEIVAPVVQNLMNETRVERLKIYNHIKDQKIDYLNQWHQDAEAFYRDNRDQSAQIINLMQESLREYVAATNTYASLKKTEESMASSSGNLDSTVVEHDENAEESVAAFEMQAAEFRQIQNDFEEYMDRLKEDIDMKADKFSHIEYYDAKLRDGRANEEAIAASEVDGLDERRRQLAVVNPLFAKKSELLPTPSVEDVTYEHMALNLPVIARNKLQELDGNPDDQSNLL